MDPSIEEKSLRAALAGLPLAEVRYCAVTGSTNDDAQRWLENGAADFALVVADQQTAGRGRLNRRWITAAGAALAFSLILHPTQAEMSRLALLSPLAGLAVADGLAACCGLQVQIKWPNDVLLGRRKVCGILAETNWQAESLTGVVLGIGVNVAPTSIPPADLLMFPATSVEDAAGRPVQRWELLAAVLKALFAWRQRLGSPEFFQAWENRLAFKDEPVQVQTPSGALEGTLVGIDAQGGLVLRTGAGKREVITVGDVSLGSPGLRPVGQTPTKTA